MLFLARARRRPQSETGVLALLDRKFARRGLSRRRDSRHVIRPDKIPGIDVAASVLLYVGTGGRGDHLRCRRIYDVRDRFLPEFHRGSAPTSAVNYFCHKGGKRQYETNDYSTNRPVLSFFILGEGWHNNHHFYPRSARAGFFWYELDFIFYVLKVLSWFGFIWDLKPAPEAVKRAALRISRTSEVETG